jgi:uncharacterized protein YfaS (alpha-2-macroglobulin family)
MVPARTRKDLTLEEVQLLFDQWRRERKRRTPIPQDLWNAAVSCAERYSLCTISSSLRLNGVRMYMEHEHQGVWQVPQRPSA